MNAEGFDKIEENPFQVTLDQPKLTFAIDVDTASYANVRRFLMQNCFPRGTRSASRRCSITFRTMIGLRLGETRPVRYPCRAQPVSLERGASIGPDRHRRQAHRREQPRRATSSF